MNKVILMGRITNNLELKQTPSGVSVLTFTIAVNRSYARQGEERQADFITCVAWRSTAEFINRYFGKGRMIAVVGNLRTRNYDDKNGTRHYVTEVYVDEASFTGEPKQQNNGGNNQGGYNNNQGGYGQGYQQNQNQGYSNSGSQQGGYQGNSSKPQDDPMNIGDFNDFDVFSDDGVPF